MSEPIANGSNGERDPRGRFAKGNRGGTGNPYAKQVAELRKSMMKAVTKRDMQQIVEKLIAKAKAGDLRAVDLLLNRIFGAPVAADVMAQIEELETEITELIRSREDEERSRPR